MTRTWLGRNRWWLLALPLALAIALASAAYRVNDLWWENGWHRVDATADQGTFVTTRATVHSFDRKPKRADLRVRLGSVRRTETLKDWLGEDRPVPAHAAGVQVRLDFEAVNGKPAPYCTAYLVDTEGSRYPVEAVDGGSNPCPPPGGGPDDPNAPKRWSRTVAGAVPERAKLEYVWVGVSWPDYVRLRVPDAEQRTDAIR